ncbi:hypothetical protein MBRA_02558 [Methylobacterium brachiatum]|nr:hypothetical protein MBRA_02558 [Methylobacterium brachiatum]
MVKWLLVAVAIVGSTPVVAQRHRANRPQGRGPIAAPQFGVPRPPTTTLRPADDGIIHWNTPNKDGNLGGPGTGGAAAGAANRPPQRSAGRAR